jgi:hypothetical protein
MAYVVARGRDSWEIRESQLTAAGPRSRTLATFTSLTPEILQRARERARKPVQDSALRLAARRAGAPVAAKRADEAAAELLDQLAAGQAPRPILKQLLVEALADGSIEQNDNAQAAAAWITATPRRRGETLRDLLMLSDHLPRRANRPARTRFPRIQSDRYE